MDRITQPQPPMEVIDLTTSESLSSDDSGSDDNSGDYDSLHFFAATRSSWYRSHYLGLLENFFTDACELQLHALDEGAATFTEDSEALVDDFIWKMMDHDLKAADNMECCNNNKQ